MSRSSLAGRRREAISARSGGEARGDACVLTAAVREPRLCGRRRPECGSPFAGRGSRVSWVEGGETEISTRGRAGEAAAGIGSRTWLFTRSARPADCSRNEREGEPRLDSLRFRTCDASPPRSGDSRLVRDPCGGAAEHLRRLTRSRLRRTGQVQERGRRGSSRCCRDEPGGATSDGACAGTATLQIRAVEVLHH